MRRNRKLRREKDASNLNEFVKMELQEMVEEFLKSADVSLAFPNTLERAHRKYLHEYSRRYNLISKSANSGTARFITLYKRVNCVNIKRKLDKVLCPKSLEVISKYLNRLKNSDADIHEIFGTSALYKFNNGGSTAMGRQKSFGVIPPAVTRPYGNKYNFDQHRQSLPIYDFRGVILAKIASHQVILIKGDTGSGKSTQVPQYLLEDANCQQMPIKIVCTQPRRIVTIALSDRVAQERNEKVGDTVGYQIRHEGRTSNKTCLVFTTSGCLLRSQMGDISGNFDSVTHIILDEIHERDKNTDFLLISLRDEILVKRSNIKIILMSATMNIDMLQQYFHDCPLIAVPGRCYDTKILYLEQVLFQSGYTTPKMLKNQREWRESKVSDRKRVTDESLDTETINFWNYTLSICYKDVSAEDIIEAFEQLWYMIKGEGLPINFQHSVTQKTALIAAVEKKSLEFVNKFLNLEADVNIKDCRGKTAIDYAKEQTDSDILSAITLHLQKSTDVRDSDNSEELQRLLNAYYSQSNDEEIDFNLIVHLIKKIIDSGTIRGAILVFLPGYNEIIKLKYLIQQELTPVYELFLIHSHMKTDDQRNALRPSRYQKIVLSTNIAETSITFPDVCHVIDAGKVKQNMYDSITSINQLRCEWISKSCAIQRAGRAGRTQNGICYRLYSFSRYTSMMNFPIPEILRVSLMEICLYTKIISRNGDILTYLMNALEPPSQVNVTNSIDQLKSMGALDNDERLTVLGKHLADIPLDVQLGKALLLSIVFRCLDPVLTIISFLSVKDPFILPSDSVNRNLASNAKKKFITDPFSDHIQLINVYNEWQKSCDQRKNRNFCEQNFLSSTCLDMISDIRNQIINHLIRTNILLSKNSNDAKWKSVNMNSNCLPLIKACLTGGMYPNICHIDRPNRKIVSKLDKSIGIHPTSVLHQTSHSDLSKSLPQYPFNWIFYNEKNICRNIAHIKTNTMIPAATVALFCGVHPLQSVNGCLSQYQKNSLDRTDDVSGKSSEHEENAGAIDSDGENCVASNVPPDRFQTLIIDKWIRFALNNDEYHTLGSLRELIDRMICDFILTYDLWNYDSYKPLIDIIKDVLIIENEEAFQRSHIHRQNTVDDLPPVNSMVSFSLENVTPNLSQNARPINLDERRRWPRRNYGSNLSNSRSNHNANNSNISW